MPFKPTEKHFQSKLIVQDLQVAMELSQLGVLSNISDKQWRTCVIMWVRVRVQN